MKLTAAEQISMGASWLRVQALADIETDSTEKTDVNAFRDILFRGDELIVTSEATIALEAKDPDASVLIESGNNFSVDAGQEIVIQADSDGTDVFLNAADQATYSAGEIQVNELAS